VRRNRFAVLIAAGALGGAFGFGASLAIAAPPGNSSCVATYTHEYGPAGHGGDYGGPVGGAEVSFVAHLPKNDCFGGQS
jgi:hypothetical protein